MASLNTQSLNSDLAVSASKSFSFCFSELEYVADVLLDIVYILIFIQFEIKILNWNFIYAVKKRKSVEAKWLVDAL